jgi:peptide deformylase
MPLLKLYQIPHKFLKQTAEPFVHGDQSVKQIANDMLATMRSFSGIGLAGNQVGLLKRILVIHIDENSPEYIMINPQIISKSNTVVSYKEGCLSVPQHYANVKRAEEVEVSFYDVNWQQQTLKADGLLSICIQHEIDHLDGIVFLDHIARSKRDSILRKLNNAQA